MEQHGIGIYGERWRVFYEDGSTVIEDHKGRCVYLREDDIASVGLALLMHDASRQNMLPALTEEYPSEDD